MRILVVEDEPKMRALLHRALTEEGYAVDTAADGQAAVSLAAVAAFDVVLLDVMLPVIDGFTVVDRLRRTGVWTPVLLLTARDAVADRVRGLDGGADDYLTKPFSLDELFARLRALIRRGPRERPTVLEAGELLIALPLVLLIATAGAYLLAAAALRPVEKLRAQAAAITDTTPDHRLDIPPGRDEIARLATTLNDMLTRLRAALDRERRLVADASHELRTPLSLLQTELDLALRRPRGAAELTAALSSAREETGRLVQLTEDLLLLARSGHTSRPDTATAVALAPLLERIATRHDIVATCAPNLAVRTDPLQLERAIANLIDNAQRHGRPPILLTAYPTGTAVEIRVRDHGPGFPPRFLPHAFDRFSRADTARTGSGTGLGLAIAAAIATSQGAANHPDGGAEVWLTFPPLPEMPTG